MKDVQVDFLCAKPAIVSFFSLKRIPMIIQNSVRKEETLQKEEINEKSIIEVQPIRTMPVFTTYLKHLKTF